MSVNLPINHPDISITRDIPDSLRNEHYYECIELKKSVNFIKIEFIDQGCGIPLTSFSFRDKNNNELFEHNNYSFGQRHLVISDKTLLSKTKFATAVHVYPVVLAIDIVSSLNLSRSV